jgi:hypothetical protein
MTSAPEVHTPPHLVGELHVKTRDTIKRMMTWSWTLGAFYGLCEIASSLFQRLSISTTIHQATSPDSTLLIQLQPLGSKHTSMSYIFCIMARAVSLAGRMSNSDK